MSFNLNYDLTELFSKNYNKPKYREEQIFKSKYKSVENIATNILKTNIKKGLNINDKNDIEWRKKMFGTNEYFSSSEHYSFISFLSMSLEDPLMIFIFIILILLIIIDTINEGIKSGYKEGLSIVFCLLIYLSLNAYRDFNSKNKTIRYDKKNRIKNCKVIRNNNLQLISNRDILVGDLLVLEKGDIVEVDGFFTQEKIIGVDESPIIQGDNKYNIKYKSLNFSHDKENNYICPFIFAGTYVVEGSGNMIVAAVGKNIYKNDKMFNEILSERKINLNGPDGSNENMEINRDEDELDEYLNNYGYFKILISAFSEQISSVGFYFFMLLGFITIVKKSVIRVKEGKLFMSLEEVDIIINGILIALIGSLFSMINSLFMLDLIGFLSDEKTMKRNNIVFKYEKYAELAFIDYLLILDNNKPLIPEDNRNKDISNILIKMYNLGVNIIFLSENSLDNAISKAKGMGIIDDYEIEKGRKILKRYKNLIRDNILVVQENPICLEGNMFYSLSGDIEKKKKKNGNEKIIIKNIEQFRNVTYNLKIISNLRKEDKFILINGLKQIGKIVAIAGNTLEDLKLMKLANFSFGNNNDNDILKENYSLVLLDNSLNTFLKAYIYSNNLVYKILQYLIFFISNFFTILIVNAIGTIIFRDIPINLIPIIFIIITVDIAAPPSIVEGNFCNKLLTKDKFSKGIPFMNNKHLFNMLIIIISRVIILIMLMVKENLLFDIESDKKLEHNMWNESNGYQVTILFCVLFFIILIHLCIIMIETNNNYIQYGFNIFVLVVILIWIINYGGKIARTKPLNQNDLLKCIGIASLTVPVDIILKIFSS